jgi:hypothetical protein
MIKLQIVVSGSVRIFPCIPNKLGDGTGDEMSKVRVEKRLSAVGVKALQLAVNTKTAAACDWLSSSYRIPRPMSLIALLLR